MYGKIANYVVTKTWYFFADSCDPIEGCAKPVPVTCPDNQACSELRLGCYSTNDAVPEKLWEPIKASGKKPFVSMFGIILF